MHIDCQLQRRIWTVSTKSWHFFPAGTCFSRSLNIQIGSTAAVYDSIIWGIICSINARALTGMKAPTVDANLSWCALLILRRIFQKHGTDWCCCHSLTCRCQLQRWQRVVSCAHLPQDGASPPSTGEQVKHEFQPSVSKLHFNNNVYRTLPDLSARPGPDPTAESSWRQWLLLLTSFPSGFVVFFLDFFPLHFNLLYLVSTLVLNPCLLSWFVSLSMAYLLLFTSFSCFAFFLDLFKAMIFSFFLFVFFP